MEKNLFPWQKDAWLQLHLLRERLPHALLFYGPQGIGKTIFSEYFARALLCETPVAEGHGCGICVSCGWFEQYSHPDYRLVRPEALDDAEEVDGADAGDADGKEKKTVKAAKTPSKEIKIDQIRALADFMNVSTHRRGKRVVVLYPAEALNTAAANALLKTLEEPPPDTVFLLVSNGLDRLLPTILSRCRKFALPMPAHDVALQWLKEQQVDNADVWLAEQGGAPLAARASAQADSQEIGDFLAHLTRPGVDGALKTAERFQKTPVVELVAWLQRWLYDVFSLKLSGKIRYYPRYRKELSTLADRADVGKLMSALKSLNQRRAIAEHPLSPKLFIEDMLLDYSTLFS